MASGGSGINVRGVGGCSAGNDNGEGSGDGEGSTRGGETDIESRISIVAM